MITITLPKYRSGCLVYSIHKREMDQSIMNRVLQTLMENGIDFYFRKNGDINEIFVKEEIYDDVSKTVDVIYDEIEQEKQERHRQMLSAMQ